MLKSKSLFIAAALLAAVNTATAQELIELDPEKGVSISYGVNAKFTEKHQLRTTGAAKFDTTVSNILKIDNTALVFEKQVKSGRDRVNYTVTQAGDTVSAFRSTKKGEPVDISYDTILLEDLYERLAEDLDQSDAAGNAGSKAKTLTSNVSLDLTFHVPTQTRTKYSYRLIGSGFRKAQGTVIGTELNTAPKTLCAFDGNAVKIKAPRKWVSTDFEVEFTRLDEGC